LASRIRRHSAECANPAEISEAGGISDLDASCSEVLTLVLHAGHHQFRCRAASKVLVKATIAVVIPDFQVHSTT
jgi:hypothetical protein